MTLLKLREQNYLLMLIINLNNNIRSKKDLEENITAKQCYNYFYDNIQKF